MAAHFVQQQGRLLKNVTMGNTVSADFKIGDHILCYEPDTSKAKMLYEAKVLEIDVTKDDKGRKVPEYFIHFIGWNKSWDRWVLGESVLEDSDVNRQLQKTLYEKAMGKKKKWKFQRQKQDIDIESIETISQSNQSTANSSHAEGDQSQDLPFVSINIPNILKNKLEDDCYYIKRKKKLLKLPRKPNAVDIFNDYLKHCEMVELGDNQGPSQSGKIINIEVVREVMEGLLTYLNFTLSTLLLYNFEKEQYDALFAKAGLPEKESFLKRELKEVDGEPPHNDKELDLKKPANKRKITRRNQIQDTKKDVSKSTLSNQVFEVLKPAISSCSPNMTQPTQRKRGRPSGKRKAGGLPSSGPRLVPCRETRATTQDFARREENQLSADIIGHEGQVVKRICVDHKLAESQLEVTGQKSEGTPFEAISSNEIARDNLKGEKNLKVEIEDNLNANTAFEKESGSFVRSLRPRRPISVQTSTRMPPYDYIHEQYTLPIGASACSMEKSNFSDTKMKDQQRHISETKESIFMSFPVTSTNSRSPAEVYGVEHLLRLFVKLPSILSRSELDARKRVVLIDYLEMFLRYIAERANGLFDKEHYSEPVI